jgi:hypothetical protein
MAFISPTSRVIIPENVLVQELDGEAILLNLKSETYFGLDDVGMRMWQVLTSSSSINSAYQILLSEYDVAPETLQNDFNNLLGRLIEQGLLEVRDE